MSQSPFTFVKSWRGSEPLGRSQADKSPMQGVAAASEGEALHFQGWTMNLPRRQLRKRRSATASLSSAEFDILRVVKFEVSGDPCD
jgi:hypothetical protein